jgi:pyridoxine kinase
LDDRDAKTFVQPLGTGDLFTALFAAAMVQGLATETALERAVSGVHAVLEETETLRSYEMALVPSVNRILRPDHQFTASPITPHINTSGPREAPAPHQ